LQKERYEWSLFFILLAGLLLRIFVSFDLFLHEWDERYHALVAKNLTADPFIPMLYKVPLLDYDFKNWASNHIWVHKQPVPIYTIALSLLIFGKNVIAVRLPSIILSTIGIFTSYKIGALLDSKRVGLFAAFLFSINGLILELTGGRVATDHIDVFFCSLIGLAIYFLLYGVKRKSNLFYFFGFLCTAAAILTKWLPALIVLPIWFLYAYKKVSNKTLFYYFISFSICVFILVIPWQLYVQHNFPVEAEWEYFYNKLHIFEGLGEHDKPFFYHWNRMRIIFGEIIYIPLIWFVYQQFKNRKSTNTNGLLLLTWIFIPYIFFSIVATKMQAYIIFCAPAIFIIVGIFIDKILKGDINLKRFKYLFLFLLIAFPIRYTLERIKPFEKYERTKPWIAKMKKLESLTDTKDVVIFNTKYPVETMFHTDFIAYNETPSVQKLDSINQLGYVVYIDNNNEIKEDLKHIKYVNFVEISRNK
jgi:4-amino-4-deoxy-L-arabinose transferase